MIIRTKLMLLICMHTTQADTYLALIILMSPAEREGIPAYNRMHCLIIIAIVKCPSAI